MGFGFLALDDGEGRIDVAHVVTLGDAVEMEVEGIELGAQVDTSKNLPFVAGF